MIIKNNVSKNDLNIINKNKDVFKEIPNSIEELKKEINVQFLSYCNANKTSACL